MVKESSSARKKMRKERNLKYQNQRNNNDIGKDVGKYKDIF